MDRKRDAEDSHKRQRDVPKLVLAGAIDLTVSGHTASLQFLGDEVIIKILTFRSAFALSRSYLPLGELIGRTLQWNQTKLVAEVADLKRLELHPNPGRIVRWVSRPVRQMLG